MIVAVLLPCWVAGVHQRADPSLRTQSFLVQAPPPHAHRVYAACPQAVASGVGRGMALPRAQAVCGDAKVIPAQPGRYRAMIDQTVKLLAQWSDRVMAAQPWGTGAGPVLPSADQHLLLYLDLGATPLMYQGEQVAELRRELLPLVGPPAIGVAMNMWIAAQAALATAADITLVPQGHERRFMAPLPLTRLPLDAEAAHRLELLGIRTAGQLAALPTGAVQAQFGGVGRLLHQLARGEYRQPVARYVPPVCFEAVRRFAGPVSNQGSLYMAIEQATHVLAERLHTRGYAARTLRLRLDTEDGPGWEDQTTLPQPRQRVAELAVTVVGLLERAAISSGVEGMTVTALDLVPVRSEQRSLLPESVLPPKRLPLSDLLARWGAGRFRRAVMQEPDAWVPERQWGWDEAEGA